jgi:hypothetical protein
MFEDTIYFQMILPLESTIDILLSHQMNLQQI